MYYEWMNAAAQAPEFAIATPVPAALAIAQVDAATSRALRDSLGRFPTGVTIMTAAGNGAGPVGLTANSFTALSLAPPLILWSLRHDSPSLAAFETGAHFAVNVLAEAQVELSRRFASRVADKFAEVAFARNEHGVPLLHGAAAWFECRTVARHAAGDHVLFIGAVERHAMTEQAPLVFHAGHYRLLGELL
jgi:flavin reductase (DIM6/NTAB) family NADH-FMN oxidoreductase RutF